MGTFSPITSTAVRPGHVSGGTRVLVVAGASPAERPCIEGELVWVPPACGDPRCSCMDSFSGATSRGMTDRAEIVVLEGIGRPTVRKVLRAAICRHCVPDIVARGAEADRLLALAARFPVGTVLVRRFGVALPVGGER